MSSFTRDLFNNLTAQLVLASAAFTTDNTTVNGLSVDRVGQYALMFLLTLDLAAAGDLEFLIEDSDDDSTWLPVEDKFLQGTEAGSNMVSADAGKQSKIGYRGGKRYVRCSVVHNGFTGTYNVQAILGATLHLPNADQVF